jgi:hypothetical protein
MRREYEFFHLIYTIFSSLYVTFQESCFSFFCFLSYRGNNRFGDVTPENRTESGDIMTNTMVSSAAASNVTNLDATNTVIQEASSQVSTESNPSASPPPAGEPPKTVITSIRTETEKAKARFLESDI